MDLEDVTMALSELGYSEEEARSLAEAVIQACERVYTRTGAKSARVTLPKSGNLRPSFGYRADNPQEDKPKEKKVAGLDVPDEFRRLLEEHLKQVNAKILDALKQAITVVPVASDAKQHKELTDKLVELSKNLKGALTSDVVQLILTSNPIDRSKANVWYDQISRALQKTLHLLNSAAPVLEQLTDEQKAHMIELMASVWAYATELSPKGHS